MNDYTVEGKQMSDKLDEMGEAETSMLSEAAPKGSFTQKALTQLADEIAKAVEKLMPGTLEGIDLKATVKTLEPDARGTVTTIPGEMVRFLGMLTDMLTDASEAGVIDPEMAISMDQLRDDGGLTMLITRLRSLLSDRRALKDLVDFLSQAPEEEIVEEDQPEAEDEMALMMERMA